MIALSRLSKTEPLTFAQMRARALSDKFEQLLTDWPAPDVEMRRERIPKLMSLVRELRDRGVPLEEVAGQQGDVLHLVEGRPGPRATHA